MSTLKLQLAPISDQTLIWLLHVLGDKSLDEEGSIELEQTRARLLECQSELDRTKEVLHRRELDINLLKQVSS